MGLRNISSKLADRLRSERGEIIVTTHMRLAAGVCALSIGLLVGTSGAVVATADTDPPGTTTGTTGGTNSGPSSAPEAPNSIIGSQPRVGDESTTPTVTAGSGTSTEQSTQPTSTVSAQTNTGSQLESQFSEAPSATPSETAPAPTETNPPAADTTVPVVDSTPPSTTAPAPLVAPAAAPPPTPFQTKVVTPVTNAFVSVAKALETVPNTLAGLPTSKTPVLDVITSFNTVLASVAGAVGTVTQASNDLYTLLGVPPAEPLIGNGGMLDSAPSVAPDAPLIGLQGTVPQAVPVIPADAPLFGTVMHASNIGGAAATGLNQELSLSGIAPLQHGISPPNAKSFLDNVVSSVLVPVSLTALAAIAIPGICGLLIVCGAGVRVGYRQAKAMLMVRASGIARFAGPGPLGVVRSGSLITLHPRTPHTERQRAARVARAKAASAARQLERVA